MKIGKELLKTISKKYTPLSAIDMVFGKYDLTLKTNAEGDPILLFAGKRDEKGLIKGDRFSHTIKYDSTGKSIKDHWERKGKAT